jgi:hypothetical protein
VNFLDRCAFVILSEAKDLRGAMALHSALSKHAVLREAVAAVKVCEALALELRRSGTQLTID